MLDDAARTGAAGLIPFLLNRYAINSSRRHLAAYNEAFARLIPAGALVLDAGAGEAPYRHLFAHARYESADFEQVRKKYAPSTYVCDLTNIPVEGERFDFVVLNQVLEHLPEPKSVLLELNRVLKKGGQIICTAPLFYEEHEPPYDFYRYTQFAHRHLFGEAGFRIDRLEWMEGYLGTVAYQLDTAARYLPTRPREIAAGLAGYALLPVLAALKLMFAVTAIAFYRLDIRTPFKTRGFPKNYVVLATKIGGPGS
jgi:ubiquinone/menaquinone biosynthesis C-methylase UbiE